MKKVFTFLVLVLTLGLSPIASAENFAELRFALADTNHDGVLSQEEYQSDAHDIDTNGDGVVDLDELLRVIQFYNTGGYDPCPYGEDGFVVVGNICGEPPLTYPVITEAVPANAGTITGGGSFEAGTNLTLTANPNVGWQFHHWTGPVGNNTSNPTTMIVPAGTTYVNAIFVAITGEGEGEGSTEGEGEGEQLPDIEILNLFPPSDGGGIIPESENFVATISATEPINTPFSLIWTVGASVVKTEVIDTENVQVWTKELDWSPPRFGVYTISLTVDADNNIAESNETNNVATTTITVCPLGGCEGEGEGELDTEAPVIHIDGPLILTVECGQEYTDDSYVTDDSGEASLFVKTLLGDAIVPPIDGHTTGVFTVEYRAEDAAGNHAGPTIRTITVEDTTAPLITLNGSALVEIQQGDTWADPGFIASDTCEGNVTNFVVVGGQTVNTSTPDTYTITYNVTDASGNAAVEVTRTVTVVEVGELAITSQTTSLSALENTAVELTVEATGSNLTFQWEASGNVAAPDIVWDPVTIGGWWGVSGMKTATLHFAGAQISSSMWYRCVVSDGTNTVTTKPIWLHVIDVFSGGPTMNAIDINMEAQGENLSITVDPPTNNPGQYFFNNSTTRLLFEFYFEDRDTVRSSVAFDGANPVNLVVPNVLAGTDGVLAFEMRGLVNEADDQGWISVAMQNFSLHSGASGIIRGDTRGNDNPDDYHWIFPKGVGKSTMSSMLDAFLGIE